jgi:dihydroorotase
MGTLVLKHGLVFTGGELRPLDIVCEGEKIAALVARGSGVRLPDAETIDMGGAWILPGVIDTHVHFREPGYEYKEDFHSGSRAAAAGGITMFVDMPNTKPPPNTVARYVEHRRLAERSAFIDFNHWGLPLLLDEVPGIAAEGAVGFKFFQKEAHYPYDQGVGVRDQGLMLEIFRTVAATGLPCLVHTHNQDVWEMKTRDWTQRGQTDRLAWREVSYGDKSISQSTGLAVTVLMADAVGARVRALHVQSQGQLKLVRALRHGGYDFLAEMNPSAVFTVDPLAKQGEGDVEANWAALEDGTINVLASDHAPHSMEEEEQSKRSSFQSVVGVFPWVEHWAALFLTEVERGRLSLRRFVELSSTAVARHLNVFPRKGTIDVGSDADLAVFQMGRAATLGTDLPVYSKAGFTQNAGRAVTAVPSWTIVRGRVVFDHGEFPAGPGYGKFIRPLPR